MAMASNFVLNAVGEEKMYTIYPWLDRVSNVVKVGDVMLPIKVPDIAAGNLLESCPYAHTTNDAVEDDTESDGEGGGEREASKKKRKVFFPRFSMCAGDFVELYKRKSGGCDGNHSGSCDGHHGAAGAGAKVAGGADSAGQEEEEELWDAVVTCFFVDTAPVVVEYVETIYGMLKPGGVWVNLGPLLYHWTTDSENNEDPRYQQSVELSWEELRHVIATFGFEFQKEEFRECQYTNNKQSIMWSTYNAILFSVIKPASSS
jgi:carnosine N-methyltransferase